MHKNYLAIDIGASSGRHIVGWMENGVLRTEEVYRFPNSVQRVDGHLEWDIDSLFANVKQGIREAFAKYPNIESLSIDTWAVDYVLLKDGQPLYPVYAYRDSRTQAVIPEVHSILPFAQLYQRTGIQFQPFNSIYQLYADKKPDGWQRPRTFDDPGISAVEALRRKGREYTNATSTGLVNAQTGEYDPEILQALGLPETMFPKLTAPGTVLDPLKADIATEVGGQTKGSAVRHPRHRQRGGGHPHGAGRCAVFVLRHMEFAGVKLAKPITNPESCRANFTNEGGVGYIRYLKNIMGLWIIQVCKNSWASPLPRWWSWPRPAPTPAFFDVNAARFSAPQDMRAEIRTVSPRPAKPLPRMPTSSTVSIIRWRTATGKLSGSWKPSPGSTGINSTSQAAAQRTPP